MSLELHKQAVADASDIELSSWISAAVKECRRRALLSKGYAAVAISLGKNAEKNAALKAAGLEHDGVNPDEVK
jgi:hypothetical protein